MELDAERSQRYVALVLRWGSLLSTIIMATGLGLLMVCQAMIPLADGRGAGVISALGVHRLALALMKGGLILLLLTPVFRIVVAIVSFALEGDRKYVLISLGVLAVVLLSIGYSFKA